jgi:hypothetical protein
VWFERFVRAVGVVVRVEELAMSVSLGFMIAAIRIL